MSVLVNQLYREVDNNLKRLTVTFLVKWEVAFLLLSSRRSRFRLLALVSYEFYNFLYLALVYVRRWEDSAEGDNHSCCQAMEPLR